ncbi:MAG: manganese efflux pump [Armatimonadetes bacterium]|nr:manganese efflux pump [Armatimonadota bacterium]
MSFAQLFAIAVGLSMDAFAVAVSASVALGKLHPRQVFRLSFHFGLFQAMMPVIGWSLGRWVGHYVVSWDHWIAFALLTLLGIKAIREALERDEDEPLAHDPTKGARMVMLSVATSIDALAIGFTFAMLKVDIWYPSAIIGVTTATLTMLGMRLGSRLGERFGRRMELLGGLVLIGIGAKIVLDHILA